MNKPVSEADPVIGIAQIEPQTASLTDIAVDTATDVFEMKVHPAADVFPMLDDEELEALADDIKANGLRQPLVVKDGVLIDGRNRREACRGLAIKPAVEELIGDPVAYILSANVNRRHLSKGQRAIAVAKLYPEPEAGGRGKRNPLQIKEFSSSYVSQARSVLKWAPVDAEAVLAGTLTLHQAYQRAQHLKDLNDTRPSRLERLREQAPDLAALVDDESATIEGAEETHKKRLDRIESATEQVRDIFRTLTKYEVALESEINLTNVVGIITSTNSRIKPEHAKATLARSIALFGELMNRL